MKDSVDRHPGAAFIAKLFGPSTQHRVYVCSLTNDRQPNTERHTITRQPSHIENFAREYDVPGRAVYYAVNTVMADKDCRCKDTIAEINAFYADIDLKDIEEDADAVRTRLEQLLRPPSARVFTGHGFHVLWLLKESVDAQAHRDEVETLLKRLAEVVGGDPSATEIARLLRCLARTIASSATASRSWSSTAQKARSGPTAPIKNRKHPAYRPVQDRF